MTNNYDVIVNLETENGEPLDKETIVAILNYANSMARTIEYFYKIKAWKVIISQAVDSRRVSEFTTNSEEVEG